MRRVTSVLLSALVVVALLPAVAAANHINDHRNIVLPDPAPNDPTAWSIRWSNETFADGSVSGVLIGRDDLFPDSLASGYLQGEDTPLLLTASDGVSDGIVEEMTRLGATSFTVLGGANAVSDDVAAALVDAGFTDGGRLEGATRFETAVAVAEGYTGDTVIIARGEPADDPTQAFADSLAAGGWAADAGWPILLTQTDVLHPAVAAFLEASDVTSAVIVGSEAAVGGTNEDDLAGLGVDVTRVAGPNRFGTAVAIAEARGFASAADADRFLVVEGQQDQAYALGFPAAAHSALADAPIVLVNADAADPLPPETRAWLEGGATYAVDINDPDTFPLFICGAPGAVCAGPVREALGLPTVGNGAALVTIDGSGGPHDIGAELPGTAELDPAFTATLVLSGDCVTDGPVAVADDGSFTVAITARLVGEGESADCAITSLVSYDNGTTQMTDHVVDVVAGAPMTGFVTDTDTPNATYSYVPDGGDEEIEVEYDPDNDTFSVDGQAAAVSIFGQQIDDMGDRITITEIDGGFFDHALENRDIPSSGVFADTCLPPTCTFPTFYRTYRIIEPGTGEPLSAFQPWDPGHPDGCDLFRVDGTFVTVGTFDSHVNEGDRLERVVEDGINEICDLTNQVVSGPVSGVFADTTVGAEGATFMVDNIGDSFDDSGQAISAAFTFDTFFLADAGYPDQEFTLDGDPVDIDEFVAAVSEGDQGTYQRVAGVEFFAITNTAPDTIAGLAQEDLGVDFGDLGADRLVIITDDGPQSVTYGGGMEPTRFIVDGVLSTEAEFLANFTAGDSIAYTPEDAQTNQREIIDLGNQSLTGDIDDIDTAGKTYDVVVGDGHSLADDLNYTTGYFGPSDRYFVDGEVVLAAFESELDDIAADADDESTIEVIGSDLVTEHHLTVVPG